jgi:hypothetical protein
MAWHPYGGKFDPAEFNVPPSLQKGTSQRLQFYIQSAHARALDLCAHSGHFPWGKDTDVARWCIQHGLQYIDQIDPGTITSVMRQANIVNAINDEEMRKLRLVETIDKTQTNVLALKGSGETDMAQDLVMRIYTELRGMPDEPERELRWKLKYLDKFKAMFGDLIQYDQ